MPSEDPISFIELAEYPECRPWANYRAAIGLVVEWLKTYEPAVKP